MVQIMDNKYYGVMGVYRIMCIPTGKMYIGGSANIGRRWNSHLSNLRLNKHKSKSLQLSWDKFGENMFKFEVIEHVNHIRFLTTIEQAWLDYFESYNPEYGFNTYPNADGPSGSIQSEKAKMKMSLSKLGKKLGPQSIEHRKNQANSRSMNWIVTSPEGIQSKIRNLNRFCRENGLDATHMVQVAKGRWEHHKGWKCEYA